MNRFYYSPIIMLFLFAASLLCFSVVDTTQASDLASTANIYKYKQPFKASNLVLQNMNGQKVSLNDYKGKVVLLHFWKIRCPACRVEEPLLKWLKNTYGKFGLEILSVNLVDPPKAIAKYAAAKGCQYPVLCDQSKGFRFASVPFAGKRLSFVVNPAQEAILEVPGLPTTYVVDCRGNLVARSVGPARWNANQATTFIRSLISDSKNCLASRGFGKVY
jgi:peroxiredoxin